MDFVCVDGSVISPMIIFKDFLKADYRRNYQKNDIFRVIAKAGLAICMM